MLSSGIIREGADTSHPIHIWHTKAEQQVRDSGLAATILRPNAFATNALQWAPQIRAGDTVRGPFADGVSAPIHEDDIAAVAERALSTPATKAWPTASPAPNPSPRPSEITAIGHAIGRDLRFDEIPVDEVGPELFPHVPPEMLPGLLKAFGGSVGTTPEITTTVEDVTGVPARPFTTWAKDHADDFR
ncbi:hypothetical protein ACRAWF_23915 [Streptomyces sp. L7]